MDREVFITADGSHSVSVAALNASYHSTHGALQESRHIFIEAGLKQQLTGRDNLSVLEIGLGTGLNALLTLLEIDSLAITVYYEALEAYPLEPALTEKLNYPTLLGTAHAGQQFTRLHHLPWNTPQALSDRFTLHKRAAFLQNENTVFTHSFDLIYFDAFAPEVQPELWTQAIFEKLYAALKPNGVLVTYCSKTRVRRIMEAAGFTVEKLPGPKGKREIVRAKKTAR